MHYQIAYIRQTQTWLNFFALQFIFNWWSFLNSAPTGVLSKEFPHSTVVFFGVFFTCPGAPWPLGRPWAGTCRCGRRGSHTPCRGGTRLRWRPRPPGSARGWTWTPCGDAAAERVPCRTRLRGRKKKQHTNRTRSAWGHCIIHKEKKKKTLSQIVRVFRNTCFLLLFFFYSWPLGLYFYSTDRMELDMISSQSGCQTWQKETTDVFKMIT